MSKTALLEHPEATSKARRLPSGRTAVVLIVAAAVGLFLPMVLDTYSLTLMLPFFAYAVALLGLNLLFGYAGLLSFGQALFLGIGAYTAAIFTSRLGIRQMEIILLTSALLSGAVAAGVGAICVRYVKIYFGLLTLAFGMLFYSFVLKFYDLTGGDQGIRVSQPLLLGSKWGATDMVTFLTGPYYYYCLVLSAILCYTMWRIVRSPFGLSLRAVKENPIKAESLGISVKIYRWWAFVIAGIYGGIAGAMMGPMTGNADPTISYWTQSGNLVFMTLLGGFTNFFGPLVGAFVFIFLQDRIMAVVPYWRLVFGVILVLIVVFAPSGLIGLVTGWRRKEVR